MQSTLGVGNAVPRLSPRPLSALPVLLSAVLIYWGASASGFRDAIRSLLMGYARAAPQVFSYKMENVWHAMQVVQPALIVPSVPPVAQGTIMPPMLTMPSVRLVQLAAPLAVQPLPARDV